MVALASFLVAATSGYFPLGPALIASPADTRSLTSETGVGQLTVSVESVPAQSIPRGATRVRLLDVMLVASCESSVSVDEIEVRHTGLGSPQDVSGVYAMEDGRRLSRVTVLDQRSGIGHVRLRRFTIAKCDSAHLSISADFRADAAAAGEHGLVIGGPQSVRSTAKQTFFANTAASTPVRMTPRDCGTISIKFLTLPGRLYYNTQQTVARVQLSSDAKEDHVLKSVTLRNEGTARDYDLLRLHLRTRSGERVTDLAPHMEGARVTLRFTPDFVLRRSETKVLLLTADVRGSITDTVGFTLEEESDLDAVPLSSTR